jgi:hypothetical protein
MNIKKNILVYICRILPFAGLIGAIYLIYSLWSDNENWGTSSEDDTELKSKRSTNRGTFVSLISAGLLNIIGVIMAAMGIKEGLIIVNYGFILGPVIGFALDQGIGLDVGLSSWRNSSMEGIKYTFKSLATANFLRYIVTVLLDLFISNPLQDILKSQANEAGIINKLKESKGLIGKWDNFVAMNFPSILQSIVGFITFQAYTNQTRFNWAYPEPSMPRELRIPPGTIMISTAIAGIVYLAFYKIMDNIFKRTYFDINTKLAYVIFAIMLLYGLNSFKAIEAPVEGDTKQDKPKVDLSAYKYPIGITLAIAFILYGLVYPFSTVLRK